MGRDGGAAFRFRPSSRSLWRTRWLGRTPASSFLLPRRGCRFARAIGSAAYSIAPWARCWRFPRPDPADCCTPLGQRRVSPEPRDCGQSQKSRNQKGPGKGWGLSKSCGAPGGARTHDPRIKSPMLYQLSYRRAFTNLSRIPIAFRAHQTRSAWPAGRATQIRLGAPAGYDADEPHDDRDDREHDADP